MNDIELNAEIDYIKEKLCFGDVANITKNSGYRYTNGVAEFGSRLALECNIRDAALHDIAHAVEFKNLNRLLINNFGLQITTKVIVFGSTYFQAVTWNSTKLEARVIIWQEVLCKEFGYNFDINDYCKSLIYMDDFSCVPLHGYTYHSQVDKLGEYLDKDGNKYTGSYDKARLKSIAEYIKDEKSKGIYTYNEFQKRWTKVIEFLTDNVKPLSI